MQNPSDLIRWIHNASKDGVSELAKLIFVARGGDAAAQRIIQHAANELALGTQAVIDKLGLNQPSDIVLSGGIVTHQPGFVNLLRERLRPMAPNARIDLANTSQLMEQYSWQGFNLHRAHLC